MAPPAQNYETKDVFAYGTLVVPEVMQALTQQDFARMPAVLDGYACSTLEGKRYPGIAPRADAQTKGFLYLGVDDASLEVLDHFEGVLYVRKRVAVRAEPLGLVSAEAYVLEEEAQRLMTTAEWDEAEFRRDYLAAFLELIRDGEPAS